MPLRRLSLCALVFLCAITSSEMRAAPLVIELEAKLAAAGDDARVDLLLQLSRAHDGHEPQRALVLARDALAHAQRRQNHREELRALARLGQALRLSSDYAAARTLLETSLPRATAPADRAERGELHYVLGQVYWNFSLYPRAVASFLEAQQIAEERGDPHLRLRALTGRAIIANKMPTATDARALYDAALALAPAVADDKELAELLNNRGFFLLGAGDPAAGRADIQRALKLYTAIDYLRGVGDCHINLGLLELAQKNLPAAVANLERALAIRQQLGAPRIVAAGHMFLARALTRSGRTDEALTHLRIAAPIADQLGSHELWRNVHGEFVAVHEARGEFREALAFQRKFETANAALVGQATAESVNELRERFDAEKRSREISDLRRDQREKESALALRDAELGRAQLQRYSLVGLLILGGITVTAVIGRQRARARAERLILEETLRARDAAEQANTLKSHLLDLASHDLKAPLVGVMMTADTIADEATDPAVIRRAQGVKQESQRMFDLVKNLLDSSAAESGQLTLRREPVDLAALVREAVPALGDRTARKNQPIEITADPHCAVAGDARRLRQVLDNLVDNASKFSPPDTTIRLVVARSAKHVRLEVHDQGPGLTEEDRRSLFQRFRRLSATPTAGESSNGLGLALAHDLVTQHGGRIWAEPRSSGGSVFITELPAK